MHALRNNLTFYFVNIFTIVILEDEKHGIRPIWCFLIYHLFLNQSWTNGSNATVMVCHTMTFPDLRLRMAVKLKTTMHAERRILIKLFHTAKSMWADLTPYHNNKSNYISKWISYIQLKNKIFLGIFYLFNFFF